MYPNLNSTNKKIYIIFVYQIIINMNMNKHFLMTITLCFCGSSSLFATSFLDSAYDKVRNINAIKSGFGFVISAFNNNKKVSYSIEEKLVQKNKEIVNLKQKIFKCKEQLKSLNDPKIEKLKDQFNNMQSAINQSVAFMKAAFGGRKEVSYSIEEKLVQKSEELDKLNKQLIKYQEQVNKSYKSKVAKLSDIVTQSAAKQYCVIISLIFIIMLLIHPCWDERAF